MKFTELDNPHAHFAKPKTKEQLENILRNLAKNTQFCSITHWGNNVNKCLKQEDIEKLIGAAFTEIKTTSLGHLTYLLEFFLDNSFLKTIIYLSQEIRTKQGLHITAECCGTQIPENLDARKTVELIHKNNGKAILEHPFTIDAPLIQYRYVTRTTDKEKIKTLKDLLYAIDGVEVFNSMNTLWQCFSNYLAKELTTSFTRKTKIYVPQLAGGDEHYNKIGNAGNLLPKTDLTGLTGEEIQKYRWDCYKKRDFRRKEHLTDLSTFYKYMIKPAIERIFNPKKQDFKTMQNSKVI